MGQKVFVLSQTEYSNILGIFTNFRQLRKHILSLQDKEHLVLHEIRLNEPEKGRRDITKQLEDHHQQEEDELKRLRRENQEFKELLKNKEQTPGEVTPKPKKTQKEKYNKKSENTTLKGLKPGWPVKTL